LTIFSVLQALGIVLGLSWTFLITPKEEQSITLNAGISAIIGAIAGGRIAYITVNWDYFQNHIFDIPQVWLGGIAWPGALIGGIFAIVLVAWLYGSSAMILIDRLLPLIASLSVVVWLGCWVTGCAYGPVSDFGLPAKDEWGIWSRRVPLQLIGAILTIALFWGIDRLRHQKEDLAPGLAGSLGLGGLSLILLGLSYLRVDPYPLYNGLRLETWAALIFLGISIICILLLILFGLNRFKLPRSK